VRLTREGRRSLVLATPRHFDTVHALVLDRLSTEQLDALADALAPVLAALDPDDTLAHRAEAAGLDATAPPQQALIDGWLIRLSPGKAKRARCVNALQAGQMPLEQMLARCRQNFDAAGLPLILRLTPFSQPADLDARLAALGWYSFDAADVMVLDRLPAGMAEASGLAQLAASDYARLVGTLRGSSSVEIAAHAERMQASPVPYEGFALRAGDGTLLCCGQSAQQGRIVGLYDIFTPAAQRGRGYGRQLCAALLSRASAAGAAEAYLQVGVDNAPARQLYRRLGFRTAYRYHYRSDDPRAAD